MRESLLAILADPVSKRPVRVGKTTRYSQGEIIEGILQSPSRHRYRIHNAIPRFVLTEDIGQKQTEGSFGYKWSQIKTYDSPGMHKESQKWMVDRYGFRSVDAMRRYFSGRRRILDAGCGSGYSASLWMSPSWRGRAGQAEWVGADISRAIDVARQRLADFPGTNFVQADVLQLPFRKHSFDAIFSEGVLHHTPSTEKAFRALVPLLAPGGEILFYVYRKKGPIREFTDDYLRQVLSPLKPEDAWKRLRPLTRLGQALHSMKAKVRVKQDVPELGIKAGTYDIQRFIYWHFAKLFWNKAYTFEENHHVNFDWYHPAYAHRHTESEIQRWCRDARLRISHIDIQESGITVRARAR